MSKYKCERCGKPCNLYNFTLLGVKSGKHIGYCRECEKKRRCKAWR